MYIKDIVYSFVLLCVCIGTSQCFVLFWHSVYLWISLWVFTPLSKSNSSLTLSKKCTLGNGRIPVLGGGFTVYTHSKLLILPQTSGYNINVNSVYPTSGISLGLGLI